MNAAPYDMLTFFDADDDDGLEVIELAREDKRWVATEPFYPDATLLVVLYKDRGVRYAAVRDGGRVAEFDVRALIVRDGSPVGRDRLLTPTTPREN